MASPTDITRVRLSTEGIEDVISALKKVQSEVGKTGKAGQSAGDALGALGTVFAARQIASFAAGAIDAADGLFKMAQKTGVAVEQLSVLTYMGQQAELSNEDLEKGMTKLAKSMVALEKGDATAGEAFRQIGLSGKDLKGLSLDQALLKVSNAQAGFADGSGKAATMMAILGKSGANMIPLMNDLANGGFDNAKTKLQGLGLVISEDMAKKSQDFNDSMKRIEMAAQGATVQVAQTFLPSLTRSMDALTGALAATPAGAKAFIGGVVGIGAASTATLVAVRTLYGALAGLGPIGIAVVALSALASGYLAMEAAADEAQAKAVKENQEQGNRVKRGGQLVEQYKQENQALEKGGLSADKRREHEARLKSIKEELIKLSPAFQDALGKETEGYKDAAKALEEKLQKEREELENKRKRLKAEFATADAYQKKVEAEANAPAEVMVGSAMSQDVQANQVMTLPMRLEDARRKASLLKAQLDGLEEAGKKPEEEKKKDIHVVDKDALKAAAAEKVAAVKRWADDVKQADDAMAKEYEDMYAHGLMDLETYMEARRSLIQKDTQAETAVLLQQIESEKSAKKNAATPAERAAAATKILDLESQILARRGQGEEKVRELERKGRDDRQKQMEEALKLEAELAQAKGQTGEAGIRAIEAEYDRRIQLAQTPGARQSLASLKDASIARYSLDGKTKAIDRAKSTLDMQVGSVDAQQGQGLISEEEAVRRKIALYKSMIAVLEEAAVEQMRLAKQTGNPDDLLKAQENIVAVEQLKVSLRGLTDQLDWVKTTARDAFQAGFANLLVSLTDQTTSLTDKVLALGRAIAQAMLQQASARIAATLTTALFAPTAPTPGVVKAATGGRVVGPGTTTSDSIPALLSRDEFVVRAAAVNRYGAGFFHALNGMTFPKGSVPGFAQGGLVGSAGGAPASTGVYVGNISMVVNASTGETNTTADTNQGLALAKQLRGAVLQVFAEESRPGGVLYVRR